MTEGLLTRWRNSPTLLVPAVIDDRTSVIATLDTVKVVAIMPKPDSFPNPEIEKPSSWAMFIFCMLLAFVYFSVLLYMFLPPS